MKLELNKMFFSLFVSELIIRKQNISKIRKNRMEKLHLHFTQRKTEDFIEFAYKQ